MKGVKKRGLSPVVSSVLLVILVIILIAMIFLWARGFLGEQLEKHGRPIEEVCNAAEFQVSRVSIAGDYDKLEIINRGNVDINSFQIKLTKDGNSEMQRFDFVVRAGESINREVILKMEDNGLPDSIEIFPILIGNIKGKSSNKRFACMGEGELIKL